MTMQSKLKVLEELLGESEISEFSQSWLKCSKANEDSIKQVYSLLQGYGLNDEKIATYAHLLGRSPETIERNYQVLKRLGLSDRKIATLANLLGQNPEAIEKNHRKALGCRSGIQSPAPDHLRPQCLRSFAPCGDCQNTGKSCNRCARRSARLLRRHPLDGLRLARECGH